MWIWQQPDWPGSQTSQVDEFRFDMQILAPRLRKLHFMMGLLVGKMSYQDVSALSIDNIVANIFCSNSIAGNQVEPVHFRNVISRRLDHTSDGTLANPQIEGIVSMYLDVYQGFDQSLTRDRLIQWHSWLHASRPSLFDRKIGGKLRTFSSIDDKLINLPAQLDGAIVQLKVPSSVTVNHELQTFIDWFNRSKEASDLDPLLRAGIVHLWFMAIYPFEKGSVQIAQMLTDLALAQAESQSSRFYAMSVNMACKQSRYYEVLVQSLKGTTDITSWLDWFLIMLEESLQLVLQGLEMSQTKIDFWREIDQTMLSSDQVSFINSLIHRPCHDGINATKYAEQMGVSLATATRHLRHLVTAGCLVRSESGGRSTKYFIATHQNMGSV